MKRLYGMAVNLYLDIYETLQKYLSSHFLYIDFK